MTPDAIAAEFLERLRWGDSPECARCGSRDVYAMSARLGGRERHMRWRCRACTRQFSVRTGTPLQETGVSLSAWARAFFAASESDGGLTNRDVERVCSLSNHSAIRLNARLPLAMPIFGWPPISPRDYFTGNWSKTWRDSTCATCRKPFCNSHASECPRCRERRRFSEASSALAAERDEWAHPKKEETWWKIARNHLRSANSLLGNSRSRRDAEPSRPARISPVSCPT